MRGHAFWQSCAGFAGAVLVLGGCGTSPACAEHDVDCDGAVAPNEAPRCADCLVVCLPCEAFAGPGCGGGPYWTCTRDGAIVSHRGFACSDSLSIDDYAGIAPTCPGANVPAVCTRTSGAALSTDRDAPVCLGPIS